MPSKSSSKGQKKAATSKFTLWASWSFLALVVIGVGYLLYLRYRPEPFPAEVDVDTAYLMYTNGTYLLDVRTETEYRVVSIPNTANIPLDQLAERLNEVPEEVDIVVVDDHGESSAEAREILREAGFSRATVMTGGLEVWILERNYLFQGVYPR